ncbi:MAG TPA: permease, partial [bacterium]|nr:permease [bacterium]
MTGHLMSAVAEFWGVLTEMSPYLLFGFLVAGILSIVISQKLVERHLGGRGFLPVLKASLFGVPLPLCSCGVIPVAVSLRHQGATRAATTSFLLSTPQTGVDSILVTFSLLGPVFAVFRPLAAFVSGLLGGGLLIPFEKDDPAHGSSTEPCAESCCYNGDNALRGRLLHGLRHGFVTLPGDIYKSLALGIALAAIISSIVPDDFFHGVFGGGFASMLLMMLVGLPLYVCATASVPIAAALIAKGVSPGTAFVFLTTGPATNAATIVTIWRTMGRRTAVLYLLTVSVTAIGGGLILDQVYQTTGQQAMTHYHSMMPLWLKSVSALVLCAICGAAWIRSWKTSAKPATLTPETGTVLQVSGMTCAHCAETVRKTLSACRGVSSVSVDLKQGLAQVQGHELDFEQMRSQL